MGRDAGGTEITREHVEDYLRRHGHPGAVVRSLAPLGGGYTHFEREGS